MRNKLFWMYVVLLLGVFIFLVPPFQKPDEMLHFKRAAALAKGQIMCLSDREHTRGFFRYPQTVEVFTESMFASHIIMNPDGKFPVALYKTTYPLSWNGSQTEIKYNCVLTVPSYIPHALGIILSIPFNSVLVSFFFARIMAAVFYMVLLFWALRVAVKPYHYLAALVGGLPMSLFLGSSVSYDSPSIPLGILILAYLTRLYDQKIITLKIIAGFMAVLLTFILVKPGYYFILVLPFLFIAQMKKLIGLGKTIVLFGIYAFVSFCIVSFIMGMPI